MNNENNNKFETVGDYNNYNRNINSMRNLGNHKSMSSSILRPYRKQITFKDIIKMKKLNMNIIKQKMILIKKMKMKKKIKIILNII